MSQEIIEQNNTDIASLSPEIQALLNQAAEEQSNAESSTLPTMSLKGKKFAVGDDKLGSSINVVILADAFDHAYYDRPYDPDIITSPACFAIGHNSNEMAPNPEHGIPVQQAINCSVCKQNEFGSAKNGTGKGKACRNGRRLLIASVSSDSQIHLSDLAIINIPPTSLKGFSRFSKNHTIFTKIPLWASIVNLSFDEDSDWPVIVPTFIKIANAASIEDIANKLSEYEAMVMTPYDCSSYLPLDETEETASTKKKSKMS
jgi:hypothetical protein